MVSNRNKSCSPILREREVRSKGETVVYKRKKNTEKRRTFDTRDWTALPNDLLDAISSRLPLLSCLSMADVCESWRCILAQKFPPTQEQRGLPWLMLCGQNQTEARTCFSILENRVRQLHIPEAFAKFCWGSIEDWLIVVKHPSPLLDIFLWNPFSRTKILLPRVWDVHSKVLLSASPTDPSCVALLLGNSGQRLSCWIPGAKTWGKNHFSDLTFADAVFCAGTFYFVTPDYNILTIAPQSLISAMKQAEYSSTLKLKLQPHNVAMPGKPTCPQVRPYLVESCGEVLLVCRLFDPIRLGAPRVTHSFEVFKLDAARMVWTKMESLGDRVLFIGKSDSRSFSAKDLGDDVANSIYFFNHDRFTPSYNEWTVDKSSPKPCSLDDWGAFSLDRNCFTPNSCNHGNNESWPPIWITAPIWWYLSDNKPQLRRDANPTVSV